MYDGTGTPRANCQGTNDQAMAQGGPGARMDRAAPTSVPEPGVSVSQLFKGMFANSDSATAPGIASEDAPVADSDDAAVSSKSDDAPGPESDTQSTPQPSVDSTSAPDAETVAPSTLAAEKVASGGGGDMATPTAEAAAMSRADAEAAGVVYAATEALRFAPFANDTAGKIMSWGIGGPAKVERCRLTI